MSASNERKHVLLVPYPAFGHIRPMLELAKILTAQHDVTMVVSEYMVHNIQERVDPTDFKNELPVRLVGLVDRLNRYDDENVTAVKFMANLLKTDAVLRMLYKGMPSPRSEPLLRLDLDILTENLIGPVHVVIADIVMGRSMRICLEREIPYHIFNPAPGIILAKFLEVEEDTPVLPDEHFYDCWDYGSGEGVLEAFKENVLKFVGALSKAESILVNSVTEFEPSTKAAIQKSHWVANKPVRFLAPLFPIQRQVLLSQRASLPDQRVEANRLKDWLDNRNTRSVIYVSMGSQAVTSSKQIKEMAQGLMSTNRPFIWSLTTMEQEWLPSELTANIENQFENNLRFLILSWAPQRMILRHRAIRLFVSHCGWNSTLETMVCGVPVVAWPMFGDQHWNANLIVKESMGIKIPNTSMMCKRIVSAPEISRVITAVGGWGSMRDEAAGINFAKKAKEARHTIETALADGGSSKTAMDDLLTDIKLS